MSYWHGSPVSIESFSMKFAGRGQNASNGALGIWLAVEQHLSAQFFGDEGFLYEISLPEGDAYQMSLSELLRMHGAASRLSEDCENFEAEVSYYESFRNKLIAQGFIRIDIVEKAGHVDMCIALDPDSITVIQKIAMAEPDCELAP